MTNLVKLFSWPSFTPTPCNVLRFLHCLPTIMPPALQFNKKSYLHSLSGRFLYLMLVGCFFLAGSTFLIYISPTLKSSNFLSSFSSSKTPTLASGSIVRKNGNEYLSWPGVLRTRCTAARNRPLVWRSRYWPTLQTSVLGIGGTLIQRPVGVRTSRP